MGILDKAREAIDRVQERQDKAQQKRETEASARRIRDTMSAEKRQRTGDITPERAAYYKERAAKRYEKEKEAPMVRVGRNLMSAGKSLGSTVVREFNMPARGSGSPQSIKTVTIEGSGKTRKVTKTTTTYPRQSQRKNQGFMTGTGLLMGSDTFLSGGRKKGGRKKNDWFL